MRTRTDHQPTTYSFVTGTDDGVAITPISIANYTYTHTTVDVVVPDFHRRMKNGEIFNNPFESAINRTYATSGSATSVYLPQNKAYVRQGPLTKLYSKSYGFGDAPPFSPDFDISAYLDDVKMEAAANVDKTPYQFMEDVAEVKKTLATLRHPLESFRKAIEMYKTTYFSLFAKLKDAAAAASQAWLAVRFAFRPIVISLMNIMDEYKNEPTRPKRRTARARSQAKTLRRGVATGTLGAEVFTLEYEYTAVCDFSAGILYNDDSAHDFFWTNGLRVKDVPATIWAVMPFSWVLDRIVDVSGFIKAIINFADPRMRYLAPWSKMVLDTNLTYSYLNFSLSGWSQTGTYGLVNEYSLTTKRSPFIPLDSLHLPKFDVAGLWKDAFSLLDIIALILVRVK